MRTACLASQGWRQALTNVVIAAAIVAFKGYGEETMPALIRRVRANLSYLRKQGRVVKSGDRMTARWGLAGNNEATNWGACLMADCGAAHTAEKFFRPIWANAVEAVRLLMVDALHFERTCGAFYTVLSAALGAVARGSLGASPLPLAGEG